MKKSRTIYIYVSLTIWNNIWLEMLSNCELNAKHLNSSWNYKEEISSCAYQCTFVYRDIAYWYTHKFDNRALSSCALLSRMERTVYTHVHTYTHVCALTHIWLPTIILSYISIYLNDVYSSYMLSRVVILAIYINSYTQFMHKIYSAHWCNRLLGMHPWMYTVYTHICSSVLIKATHYVSKHIYLFQVTSNEYSYCDSGYSNKFDSSYQVGSYIESTCIYFHL